MDEAAGKIRDAELEVMRVLWEAEAPLPLLEICRALLSVSGSALALLL